jgi:putative effector of murein hydrolase
VVTRLSSLRSYLAIVVSLVAGSLTAILTAVVTGWLLGLSDQSLLSIAPKSVTTPLAMGISEAIGGLPSLTAVIVILTGISGAVLARSILNALGIHDWRARGFAIGLAAHGIGTARAFQVNRVAGVFASVAMVLNGFATALFIPLLLKLI